MSDRSDLDLIEGYLKGAKTDLEILISRYLKPIYRFVFRFTGNSDDTEDITQDVFVKMWRNIKKFDRSKNFKTWIFSIAHNTAVDFVRKKKSIPFSEFDDEEGGNAITDTLADDTSLPDELFRTKDLSESLSYAIDKLPPKQRTVMLLRYSDDFTFKEIAQSLNESIDTVKTRHFRGVARLKDLLTEK